MLTESGMLTFMVTKKIMFLVVEQTVTYTRPILPLDRYAVTTTIKLTDDDKWAYYRHSFDAPANPKSTEPTKHYAVVTVKVVLKESSGKTVKQSEVLSPYHKNITIK